MAVNIGRQNFVAVLGGATVAWPLISRAEQHDGMRRIGVFVPGSTQTHGQYVSVSRGALGDLGYDEVSPTVGTAICAQHWAQTSKAIGGFGMSDQPPNYMITRVTRWASANDGDTIQIETIVSDGSPLILRSAYKDASRLIQALIEAASIAEQKQAGIPDQDIPSTSSWMATSAESGLSTDGKYVGLLYLTTEGVPIHMTMSPELARETIQRLSSELDRLDLGLHAVSTSSIQ